MLKGKLLHPQILDALGRAGHCSKVLIADGNYPFSTRLGPRAVAVYLNLSPGRVNCVETLEALLTAIPVEAAAVMQPERTGLYAMHHDPPIWKDFRRALRAAKVDVELEPLEKPRFCAVASAPDVALTIATGEQRIYANILLTIGGVLPD